MEQLSLLFEMIGTIAFAISGAVVGLKSRSDLFGVVCLGVVTATAGGVMRDLILGITPPTALVKPLYVLTSIGVSLAVFLAAWILSRRGKVVTPHFYRLFLLIADSIGLGMFTVMGTEAAWYRTETPNFFLSLFCGMITAVGGGVLRDMIVDRLPDIFRKHIYAIASLCGSACCCFLFSIHQPVAAIYASAALVVVIRLLAAHYRWSLPKISHFEEIDGKQ